MADSLLSNLGTSPNTNAALNTAMTQSSSLMSRTEDDIKKMDEEKSRFLKMLMAELKNQDPTNPTDTKGMTQQLIGFSQVEQAIQSNQHLTKLAAMYQRTTFMSSATYIGKRVEVRSDQIGITNHSGKFSYTLPAEAKDLDVNIVDTRTNTIVANFKGNAGMGRNDITINDKSLDLNGQPIKDGVYKVQVTAKDVNDKPMKVLITTTGVVDSVSYLDEQPLLHIGNGAKIPMEDILSLSALPQENAISQSIAAAQQQMLAAAAAQNSKGGKNTAGYAAGTAGNGSAKPGTPAPATGTGTGGAGTGTNKQSLATAHTRAADAAKTRIQEIADNLKHKVS